MVFYLVRHLDDVGHPWDLVALMPCHAYHTIIVLTLTIAKLLRRYLSLAREGFPDGSSRPTDNRPDRLSVPPLRDQYVPSFSRFVLLPPSSRRDHRQTRNFGRPFVPVLRSFTSYHRAF